MRRTSNVKALIEQFAAVESEFLQREFLAPVAAGGTMLVRIAGAVCRLQCQPADFSGWGVFKPVSYTHAKVVREPTLRELEAYFRELIKVRFVLTQRLGRLWFGVAASAGRVQVESEVPVLLAESVQAFDAVIARFDGQSFWFSEVDRRQNWKAAEYLRAAFENRNRVEQLQFSGLTSDHRHAYQVAAESRDEREREAVRERRLRRKTQQRSSAAQLDAEDEVAHLLHEQVSHAGATFKNYTELKDGYRVSFVVDGEHYTSVIGKRDGTVQAAGICLNGHDQKFDLASLVGVLREGAASGSIYRED